MNRHVVCLGLLFWSIAGICAEQTTIDLGGNRHIQVPIPDGFRALGDASPAYRAYSDKVEIPGNVLLEVLLSDKDFSDVVAGRSERRERELKIEDPRQALGLDLDGAAFDRAVANFRAMADASSTLDSSANSFFESKSQHFVGGTHGPSEHNFSGKFLDRSDAVGIVTCGVVTTNLDLARYCVAKVVAHIRDRAVTLSVATSVHGDGDVDWMKTTASSWALRVIAANPN
jgi:hypothetical protein